MKVKNSGRSVNIDEHFEWKLYGDKIDTIEETYKINSRAQLDERWENIGKIDNIDDINEVLKVSVLY